MVQNIIFGYIGQSLTTPWNASERYIVAMEVDSTDKMPEANDAARIILIDTLNNNMILQVDETNAWNPQQGTMFYWNPLAPETQFFFNDRDVITGEVYTVLFDVELGKKNPRIPL